MYYMYKRYLTYFLIFKIDIYKFYVDCITIAFILDKKRKEYITCVCVFLLATDLLDNC